MTTPRHIYVVQRVPVEPSPICPNGIGGCLLTASKDEAEAKYWARLAEESTAEFGFTYSTTKETLQ